MPRRDSRSVICHHHAMPRRRTRQNRSFAKSLALVVVTIPALYLLAALVGSFVPVNAAWREPSEGVTVYLADNGVHADLVLPASVNGLDWRPLLPAGDVIDARGDYVAFGAGERRVYLDTPTWADLTPGTALHAIGGGERVVHVEWVRDPTYAARAIRLTPEQYRRLWAAVRAEFRLDTAGHPQRIDHPGYGPADAFYHGVGKASALSTCNVWVADRLRIAGVKAPLWSPFVQGLVRWYRR